MKSSQDLGHVVLSDSFCLQGAFSFLILCTTHLVINHCDIIYLLHCLTFPMLCFPGLD